MMLPQHKEALIERRNPRVQLPEEQVYPTTEELELMKDSVLLPIMHTFVLKRTHTVENSSDPLRQLYAKTTEVLAKHIQLDLLQVRRCLAEKKIHIHEDEKDDHMLRYRYKYRGYEDHFTITRDYLRVEMGMRIGRYVDGLLASLYGKRKVNEQRA